MPKRIGFIYDIMYDKDFIRKTIINGTILKRGRKDVQEVLRNLDYYVDLMYDILINHRYIPSIPIISLFYDKSSEKTRKIGSQPYFPDGLANQLAVEAVRERMTKGFHYYSCASIPDRGGKRMLKYSKYFIQEKPKSSRYVAELDIKQFYPSVPLKSLIKALRRKYKDETYLQFIALLITCDQRGQKYFYDNHISAEEIVGDKVGLIIGFFINQWLSNFYLSPVDRLILSFKSVKFECRYADNINIAGPNKKKLHKVLRAITEKLCTLGLKLKENWQLYKADARMLSTVGYRIGRDRVIMRKRNFLRFARQCRRALKRLRDGKAISFKMAASLMSRIGQLKHCDSFHFKQKYVYPIGIGRLRKIIRTYAKKQNDLQYMSLYGGF